MANGTGEFMEKNIGGNNRKRVQAQLDRINLFDIPSGLQIIKSDSARFLDIDDKGVN